MAKSLQVGRRLMEAGGAAALTIALTTASPARVIINQQGVYEESKTTLCSNVSTCEVEFTAVPANKTLIVTHISCHVFASNGPNELGFLGLRNGPQRFTFLTPVRMTDGNRWQANNEVVMVFAAASKPTAFAVNNAVVAEMQILCRIAGQLKT